MNNIALTALKIAAIPVIAYLVVMAYWNSNSSMETERRRCEASGGHYRATDAHAVGGVTVVATMSCL